jgi:hypothetical protein
LIISTTTETRVWRNMENISMQWKSSSASGPDDGFVPPRSADPGGQFFKSLGHTDNLSYKSVHR